MDDGVTDSMPRSAKTAPRSAASRRRRRPGRPKNAANQDTREKLLDAAAELSTTKPLNRISMREVALAAGLSPALTRYYFDSPQQLQGELLRKLWKRINIPDSNEVLTSESLPDFFFTTLRRHIQTIVDSPEMSSLLIQNIVLGEHETVDAFNEVFLEPTRKALKPVLAAGVDAGVFNKVDEMDFMLAILGAASFYAVASGELASAFGKKRITRADRERFSKDLADFAMHLLLRDPARFDD